MKLVRKVSRKHLAQRSRNTHVEPESLVPPQPSLGEAATQTGGHGYGQIEEPFVPAEQAEPKPEPGDSTFQAISAEAPPEIGPASEATNNETEWFQAELLVPDEPRSGRPTAANRPDQNESELRASALAVTEVETLAETTSGPDAALDNAQWYQLELRPADEPKSDAEVLTDPPSANDPKLGDSALAATALEAPVDNDGLDQAEATSHEQVEESLRMLPDLPFDDPLPPEEPIEDEALFNEQAEDAPGPGEEANTTATAGHSAEDQPEFDGAPVTTPEAAEEGDTGVVVDEQFERTLDPEERNRVEPDFAADIGARFEDCAAQPAELTCGEEGSEEIPWRSDQTVDVGGETGQPVPAEQAPRQTILIIDDDPMLRMLLKMGLEPHGYDCLAAENGKAAQPVFEMSRPDLILLDLLMPVMDGLAFIHWLRHAIRDSTPILVFTNVDNPRVTQEALRSGANSFVYKPIHLKDLLGAIRELVPA